MKLKHTIVFLLVLLGAATYVRAQSVTNNLPKKIYSGGHGKHHVQGAVVDTENGYAYFSFTTKLIKTDLNGNIIGSVDGLAGHLGCLTMNPADGKIYGSLEYKNDEIGRGIDGERAKTRDSGFYIAIFDTEKITRTDMDAEKDEVMTAVFLKEPTEDYYAKVTNNGKEYEHRYACSGIDGVTFAPELGKGIKGNDKKMYLCVAYGVYGDTTRTDNDYQVILTYDTKDWDKYEKLLSQDNLHKSGPSKPKNKYFLYTGNTTYGIQNMAYDPTSGNTFVAVYKGKKSMFPNYSLFVIDGKVKPQKQVLKGLENEKGIVLSLLNAGSLDEASGIRGWNFKYGTTGMWPLGSGLFYISHNGSTDDKQQCSELNLYRWIGSENESFELIK